VRRGCHNKTCVKSRVDLDEREMKASRCPCNGEEASILTILYVTFSFHLYLLDVALPAFCVIRDVSRDVKVK